MSHVHEWKLMSPELIEILVEAIHPVDGPIAVDCCMGSTVRSVHRDDPEFAEQEHRRWHTRDAARLANNLEKAGYRLVRADPTVKEAPVGPGEAST